MVSTFYASDVVHLRLGFQSPAMKPTTKDVVHPQEVVDISTDLIAGRELP